jgi:membrane fusion protein, multidrug efflux system
MIKIKTTSAIVAIAMIMTSCGNQNKAPEQAAIPVKILAMAPTSTGADNNYVGTIVESFGTTLSFETAGNVQHVYVKEGQKVSKGQLIATLNESNAQNAYNVAKATLEKAQDGYARAEQLYKNKSLSEIKWVEIQTALIQAQSMADIAKKNLQDCKMMAPITGVISSLKIEQGMNVIPFQSVAKVVDIEKLNVNVSIPENEIADVNIGQKAIVTVSALGNTSFSGTITERGVEADLLSHCYGIKIGIDNPEKKLLPGMVCKVLIESSDTTAKAFQVPVNTIQISNDGKRYVWVAADGKAQRKFVTIGKLCNKNVIIESGIKEGDLVIVEGWQKVSEESPVKCQ